MKGFIPYGRQNISQEDIDEVVRVLQSDFLTQGPAVEKFEEAISQYTGAKYSIALNSATSALHASCLAMGLGAGDELWTSPISFVASSNCALYCGAKVDFVDIDLKTYNLCPNKLEDKLKKTDKIPKIVVPVHLSGQSCDMEAFQHLAEKYGFKVLEDASHAIGADYLGTKVGSCQYSDASIFSFHPVKIITTGEGGMVTTNNEKLYEKLKLFRSHGVTRDPKLMRKIDGPWYYEQIDLGYNYRITDIQCALGLSQLKKLDEFIIARRNLAKKYNHLLVDSEVTLPFQSSKQLSSWHLYIIKTKNRKEVFDYLRANNIGVNVHYIPIHTQPYYQNMGFKKGDFPVAEQYYEEAMSLPLHPNLTPKELEFVIDKLNEALGLYTLEKL